MTEHLVTLAKGRPIAVQSSVAGEGGPALTILRDGGIPVLEWPSELAAWFRAQATSRDEPETRAQGPSPVVVDHGLSAATEVVRAALAELGVVDGIGQVLEPDDVASVAAGRWVLRADGFPHKRLAGAIHVDLSVSELPAAYADLVALTREQGLPPVVRIAPLVAHDYEFVLTVWGNAHEGSGIAIGGGGSDIERDADIALGRLPRQGRDVTRLLGRTRAGSAFLATATPAHVAALADFVVAFAGRMDSTFADYSEIELNPVAVGVGGVSVLDALPVVRDSVQHTNSPTGKVPA